MSDATDTADPECLDHEAIHSHFNLTYAAYLVVPRAVLQSMPPAWQREFVALLGEMGRAIPYESDQPGNYHVSYRDPQGRVLPDGLRDYERGRRRLGVRCFAPGCTEVLEGYAPPTCVGCGRYFCETHLQRATWCLGCEPPASAESRGA